MFTSAIKQKFYSSRLFTEFPKLQTHKFNAYVPSVWTGPKLYRPDSKHENIMTQFKQKSLLLNKEK